MIEKFIKGTHLKRLDNIIQWQEKDVFTKESVSQHSFKVTIFTRMILEEIFGVYNSGEIAKFKLDCVTKAMFHDWDEAIFLRDISHEIKYNTFNGEKIREVIKEYVENEFNEEFSPALPPNNSAFDVLYAAVIDSDKCVKSVVKLADWLALYYFCEREINLGNKDFDAIKKYCENEILKAVLTMDEEITKRFSGLGLKGRMVKLYEDIKDIL